MKRGTINPVLKNTITELEKTKKPIWNAIARKLKTPTRQRASVNLWKIDKNSREGDVVVIPGKFLSEGELHHKVTVTAFNASDKALIKLKEAGSTYMTLTDAAAKTPKGRLVIME